MKHKGKRFFITGIPTSGKTYLAKKLADKIGGVAVVLDELRKNILLDDTYKKWINFYLDKDEEFYFAQVSPEEQWGNLVAQSEGLWPVILEEINKYSNEERSVIFECVNILPHLAKKDLDFPGIVLLGSSYEETLLRNSASPRWGSTAHLQEMEAKAFFFNERPHYKKDAQEYGYMCFDKVEDAFVEAMNILGRPMC